MKRTKFYDFQAFLLMVVCDSLILELLLGVTCANAQQLNIEQARKIFALPVECIRVEFPNKPGETLGKPEDLKRPAELRPIFYGCFDWHSCVHGYWSIVKLMKEYPALDSCGKVRALLNAAITDDNLAVEQRFFEDYNNRNFERTYGWAWFLTLQKELYTWDDPDAQRWYHILKPLEDLLTAKYEAYLPKLMYPLREGMHGNSAFSLSLAIDYARAMDNCQFESAITEHAKRLYLNDKNAPLAYEPSGSDFLSPCLEEALLMSKTLDKDEYRGWLESFLPELFDSAFRLAPGIVSDRSDGHLVHLDGLNFSRAACLYGIAAKLPVCSHLKAIAEEHLNYSIHNITGEDDYMGSHWLGTFALWALSCRDRSPSF
ncbi:MAG: DUF2891 domain-containing protein [Dysgonamonadaceae bacterium]|jgi:hypothetical protein|nr:DUF2891 domain-containing protein [Dysgonamonadaceae bacterium]